MPERIKNMKTRKQYMNKECTHREYYAQFVTPKVKDAVLRSISKKSLLSSKDEHLNDINLSVWDRIGIPYETIKTLREHGEGCSLATAVCINKEAARQIIESA